MKKVIVTDLDGALLRDDGTVSEYTKKVIRKASEEYILIAASGRAMSGIKKALDDLFQLFTFFYLLLRTSDCKLITLLNPKKMLI